MAYLAGPDEPCADPALWWRATIVPLYTRLKAQYPALFARSLDADGATSLGSGASVAPSPFDLAGATSPAPASTSSAFRDGARSVRTPMLQTVVASHLPTTVAGIEQRGGGGPHSQHSTDVASIDHEG